MVLAFLLLGCGLSPDRFAHEVSYAWCDWRHGCDQIDADQADACWQNEEADWQAWLAAEACDYPRERSRRLLNDFDEALDDSDCDAIEGYALLGALRMDACSMPHTPVDTQEPEDTGPDSGA